MFLRPVEIGLVAHIAEGDILAMEWFEILDPALTSAGIAALAGFVSFFALRILRYLGAGISGVESLDVQRSMLDRLNNFQTSLDDVKLNQEIISESDRDQLVKVVKRNIVSTASEDYIRDLEKTVSRNLKYVYFDQTIKDNLSRTYQRLSQEIESLGRRGNVNLVLGMVTSIMGFAMLLYFVVDQKLEGVANDDLMKNMTEIGTQFLPRLSLVILIEIFAYFFLSLYKNSLSEIKYFQNELTNLEAKYTALQLAVSLDDVKSVSGVIESFAETERNFVLRKGETTVDVERFRIDSGSHSSISKMVADILEKTKSMKRTS